MKHVFVYLSRMLEILLIVASICICINYVLSGHENLEYGIERITGLTGYVLDAGKSELILHKTNASDSIVMVEDNRSIREIKSQMDNLLANDDRWTSVHIAESEAYPIIHSCFSGSYQTSQHYRPVCEIDNGFYDYLFFEKDKGGIIGCLIDIDTGTIALYIFNTR